MNLKDAYLRVTAETKEQFEAALQSDAAGLISLDAGYFKPGEYRTLAEAAHSTGKYAGLRLPHIWRTEAEHFFDTYAEMTADAGFDAYLFRNWEGLIYFARKGLIRQGVSVILDHTMYEFNETARNQTEEFLKEISAMIPGRNDQEKLADQQAGDHTADQTADQAEFTGNCTSTLPLELDFRELKELGCEGRELVVYGRIPMMVSAQCVRRTAAGCDRHMCCMQLKDRSSNLLPVKNCCTFCYNTIYNSVPTRIYDMTKELSQLHPGAIRCEFTVETAEEVCRVLDEAAGLLKVLPGNFTKVYFKRGVE